MKYSKKTVLVFLLGLFLSNAVYSATVVRGENVRLELGGRVLIGGCKIDLDNSNNRTINLGRAYNNGVPGQIVPLKFVIKDCIEDTKREAILQISKQSLVNPESREAKIKVNQTEEAWINIWTDPSGEKYFNPRNDEVFLSIDTSSGTETQTQSLWAQLEAKVGAKATHITAQANFLVFYN